jgi:hypothetical protein
MGIFSILSLAMLSFAVNAIAQTGSASKTAQIDLRGDAAKPQQGWERLLF